MHIIQNIDKKNEMGKYLKFTQFYNNFLLFQYDS